MRHDDQRQRRWRNPLRHCALPPPSAGAATVRSDPNDSVARSPAGPTRRSIFSRRRDRYRRERRYSTVGIRAYCPRPSRSSHSAMSAIASLAFVSSRRCPTGRSSFSQPVYRPFRRGGSPRLVIRRVRAARLAQRELFPAVFRCIDETIESTSMPVFFWLPYIFLSGMMSLATPPLAPIRTAARVTRRTEAPTEPESLARRKSNAE